LQGDNNKNKTSETITGTMSGYGFSSTTYDDEDRLTGWNRTDNALTKSWSLSAVGDWNSVTENSSTQSRTHGPTHELLTAAGQNVTTDTKGNMTVIPAVLRPGADPLNLTWDMDNRLSSADVDNDSVADVSYQFDALGRRVARDDGTNVTVYVQSGQQTIADYASGAAATSPTYTYYYASYIDEPIYRTGTGASRYYHRNQQYSITALTDFNGNVTERYAYTAYGTPTITDSAGATLTNSADNNRYLYTGREWDESLSLYHYRARMYDAISGRFCSRDPIGFEGGTRNTYEYVSGQPTFGTDPLGLAYGTPRFRCGGKLIRTTNHNTKCCGGKTLYNSNKESCVNGQVVPKACAGIAAGGCSTCTIADCKSDMETLEDHISGTEAPFWDWEYIWENGTADQCDRWVRKAYRPFPKLKCMKSKNAIRWDYVFVGGHVAIKITLCDGTVMYIDNGWEGGDDGIFWPEDVDGFPYTNPMEGPY
jgi:RHS repeat-associated protein